jgi:hypothetical protein
MLARQDGTRPSNWNDYYRVREACQAAEERHGLRRTAPGDRTAGRRPTRAEHEKAHRHGRTEAPRITLRRAVCNAAAAAGSETEFFGRLREAGVLVRVRSSVRDPGQVTGYAVALAGDTARDGRPVWFSGGKLAADLSLPKLRARWTGTRTGLHGTAAPGDPLTAAERDAIWQHVTHTAAYARNEIRRCALTDPAAASDVASAASDTLHAAAAALGSKMVRQAADAYARAARVPYARIPRRSRAGTRLRHSARLLSAAGLAGHNPALGHAALIARLASLIEAVTELREAQQRAAQASAARIAAEQLRWAAGPQQPPPTPQDQSAVRVAAMGFPSPPPADQAHGAAAPVPPSRSGSRTTHRPGPPHRRGPRR